MRAANFDQIADAAIVHDPEHQPQAAVLAEQHPPRRRTRRRALAARAAEGLDGDHPRPVGVPRGGGVDGDTVRAVVPSPGSWLILQATGAGPSSWKPWARLEAWRERGPVDALGYRLELVFDSGPHECAVPIAESSISTKRGGQFVIDPATFPEAAAGAAWPFAGGFVMGSTVEGEGRASRPTVQVGVQHVTCMGDVAVFVALSAAVDLCMDACKLFSQRLRKELCQDQDE